MGFAGREKLSERQLCGEKCLVECGVRGQTGRVTTTMCRVASEGCNSCANFSEATSFVRYNPLLRFKPNYTKVSQSKGNAPGQSNDSSDRQRCGSLLNYTSWQLHRVSLATGR